MLKTQVRVDRLKMNSVFLKSVNGRIEAGGDSPIKVNCNVGANSFEQMAYEYERLKAIKDSNLLPDTFMDLSIGHYDEPLYKEIIREFGCPVGMVPADGRGTGQWHLKLNPSEFSVSINRAA